MKLGNSKSDLTTKRNLIVIWTKFMAVSFILFVQPTSTSKNHNQHPFLVTWRSILWLDIYIYIYIYYQQPRTCRTTRACIDRFWKVIVAYNNGARTPANLQEFPWIFKIVIQEFKNWRMFQELVSKSAPMPLVFSNNKN